MPWLRPGLAGLIAAAAAALPAQACTPRRLAEVPVRVIEGFPIVPASIGGTPVSLLLDTGAQGNLLTPEAVAALGLRTTPGVTTRVFGTGGERDVPTLVLTGLRLGGTALTPSATPVAPLPGSPATDPPLAGLLGATSLSGFDLDLDVPAGRVTLYENRGCAPAGFERAAMVPLDVTTRGEAFLPVQVNGQDLLALLDTGSRATLLTQQAAQRLGLGGAVSANTARGIDGERLPLQHIRVREMRIGTEIRGNVPVSIAPLQLGQGDVLLGLDYLGQRRVFISYAAGQAAIAAPAAAPSLPASRQPPASPPPPGRAPG